MLCKTYAVPVACAECRALLQHQMQPQGTGQLALVPTVEPKLMHLMSISVARRAERRGCAVFCFSLSHHPFPA